MTKSGAEMKSLDSGRVKIKGQRQHRKASETYLDVEFRYGAKTFEWSIPIEYRRTGVDLLNASQDEINKYLDSIYTECDPANWDTFRKEQSQFWKTRPNAAVTKSFYDGLEKSFEWTPIGELPNNPNYARRIQEIKECGFTIATDSNGPVGPNGRKTMRLLLLPIKRGGRTGYETWSPALRARIVAVLGAEDSFEAARRNKDALLPDHKFPEIRWDENVARGSLEGLTDAEIVRDFQLIDNQRNQQKREACRTCFQTGIRPNFLNIEFFYQGGKNWNSEIPRKGKAAEAGCIGCGWYDIKKWRQELNDELITRRQREDLS